MTGMEDVEEVVEYTPKEKTLINRIRLMLGGSVVKVEISDKDIKQLIDIALDTVAPYIVDYKYLTFPYSSSIDLSNENVEEVLRVIPATDIGSSQDQSQGEEFIFDFTSWSKTDSLDRLDPLQMIRRKIVPDIDIPFEYDAESKTLMVKRGVTLGNITVECIPEVLKLEDLRDKSTLKWVYLYTLALAKEVVGRIRSKAKSTNIPIELDGETLLSEASTEKGSLESSLLADQTGPIAMIR